MDSPVRPIPPAAAGNEERPGSDGGALGPRRVARIATPRLWLRRFAATDAPALRASLVRSRDHLARWVPLAEPMDERRLGSQLAALAASPSVYAVIARADGRLLGSAALERGTSDGALAIAYWLDVAEQGRGYATEAAAALARVALEISGASVVEITCDRDNQPSARVARRAGFVAAGVAEIGGRCLDRYVLEDPAPARSRAPAIEVFDDAAPAPSPDADDAPADRAARHWARMVRWADGEPTVREVTSSHITFDCHGVAVTAALASACGHPWVVVSAMACSEYALHLRDALAHNATLAIGGLALEDGGYVLRHAVGLAALQPVELATCVDLIGHEAARLGSAARRDRIDLAAFDLYTD